MACRSTVRKGNRFRAIDLAFSPDIQSQDHEGQVPSSTCQDADMERIYAREKRREGGMLYEGSIGQPVMTVY
jgi:hypothetical protein